MLYDMREESGRMGVRLKAHHFVPQDIQDYGPLGCSDPELEKRARYHAAQMQAQLPTPQTLLTNDFEAFSAWFVMHYIIIYKGLYVAYTGLKAPYCLPVEEPRYTTSVNFDGSDSEQGFVGLVGLLAALKAEQDSRREGALEDGEDAAEYLLTRIQVSVYDATENNQAWYDVVPHFLLYSIDGDQIVSAYEQTDLSDDVLSGLGLPNAEALASAKREG